MFLVQVTNMGLVLVFVMYLVKKYVVVSTNIFLSWLTRGILRLQHLSTSSCGRAEGRDRPSGTCRVTSTKVDPVD